MKLNWKSRILLLILILLAAVGSFLFNAVMIKLPSGTNEEDPLFFGKNNYANFYYNNGTLGNNEILSITSIIINNTHSNVSIKIDNILQGSFFIHPNGTVYQKGKCQGNYSIWWLHVSNPMLNFGQGTMPGTIYSVVDPTGFLGTIGENYTVIVDRKLVYWPTDIKFSFLLGAQASFIISVYSDQKIAEATLDLTCGLVELWDGGQNSRQTLALYETNYPISRNRINAFSSVWVFGIVIIAITYLFMRVDWKNKLLSRIHLNSEKRNDVTLLMSVGLIAIGIEYVDIWFYCPLDIIGNVILHSCFIGLLGIVCLIQRKRFVWLIPAFLEVAFILAMTFFVGDPFVPHLTAFMGSTISWLCLIWVSGNENIWNEGKTWIGKFLSKFS